MKIMLRYEIKKVFTKPLNKAVLLILALALAAITFFAAASVEYVDAEGHSSCGIAAARRLREEKNGWKGDVTEQTLLKALRENVRINGSEEYLSKDLQENNKAYSKKQGFSDIRNMINLAFGGFQEYDYYKIDSVKETEVRKFYENRIHNLKEWLYSGEAAGLFTDEKKEFLIGQYESLETPFYYEYADGWKALLEYAPTLIALLILVTGFLVSGIFSDEFQLKADAVYFSSKLGRTKGVISKIEAGFLIISAVYWTVMLLYSLILFFILGADGADCAIQTGMAGWKSFYNITYFQEYLLTVFGGYLGSLFILTLSMLASAKLRSALLAVTMPFILLFLPSFFNGIPPLLNLLALLPDRLVRISEAISYFNLYQLGGTVVGAIPILFALYLILYCLLLPVLYRTYRKAEIR